MKKNSSSFPLIILSGLSGAGKTTALKVFEDIGFFCVDGLLPSMFSRLISFFCEQNPSHYRGLALVWDIRQKEFLNEWKDFLNWAHSKNLKPFVIFLECEKDVLVKRYLTTRRPHPLEFSSEGLVYAIEKEKELLKEIKKDADLIIDTTHYSIHDLRRFLQEKCSTLFDQRTGFRVHIISFGYKFGIPLESDLVFDLRFLPNPYFVNELKNFSGKEEKIKKWIFSQKREREFLKRLLDFIEFLLNFYISEGRYRVTISFGCTGGFHRSVAVAELVYEELKKKNYTVTLEHRHLGFENDRNTNSNPL